MFHLQINRLYAPALLWWVKVVLLLPSSVAIFTLENCTQPSFGKFFGGSSLCSYTFNTYFIY